MTAGGLFGSSPGGAEAAVRAWSQAAQDKAARYQDMAVQVEQVRQSARSRDGAVTVTVAASGQLTDLVLSDLVRQWEPQRTAAEVLRCMRQAQSQLAAGVQEVVVATIGDDPVTAESLVAGYEQRFPAPPPEDPPTPDGAREMSLGLADDPSDVRTEPPRPPSRPTRRDEPDDDDFYGGGVLQ